MTWATWLLSVIGPAAVQVIIALGVGVLTITGVDLVVHQALDWVAQGVGGIPADMANVLGLAGVFDGMAYIAGAFTARVALAGAGTIKKWFIK